MRHKGSAHADTLLQGFGALTKFFRRCTQGCGRPSADLHWLELLGGQAGPFRAASHAAAHSQPAAHRPTAGGTPEAAARLTLGPRNDDLETDPLQPNPFRPFACTVIVQAAYTPLVAMRNGTPKGSAHAPGGGSPDGADRRFRTPSALCEQLQSLLACQHD